MSFRCRNDQIMIQAFERTTGLLGASCDQSEAGLRSCRKKLEIHVTLQLFAAGTKGRPKSGDELHPLGVAPTLYVGAPKA